MTQRKLTVIDPVLGKRETLPQPTVLVRLGEQPRSIHKVLSAEELGNLLVPERDVSGTVVDDRAQLAVALEIAHEVLETVDTVDEVDDALLLGLLVERLPDIVDGLAEDGRETDTHSSLAVSNARHLGAAKRT